MIITRCFLKQVSTIHIPLYNYHLYDLMRRGYKQRKVLIFSPANHLYLDKFLKQKFHERKLIFILLEQDKLNVPKQIYEKLFKFAYENIDKIYFFRSFSVLLSIAFEIKLKNPQMCQQFAKKGFTLLRQPQQVKQNKGLGYSLLRFMIAVSKLVGLSKFTDEEFSLIQIDKIKPIFITFLLELFWRESLQQQYQFPKKLLQSLKKNEKLIPFTDVHHMLMCKKIIRDPQFFELTNSLQMKIRQKIVPNPQNKQSNIQTRVNPEVTINLFNQYIRDLQAKYL